MNQQNIPQPPPQAQGSAQGTYLWYVSNGFPPQMAYDLTVQKFGPPKSAEEQKREAAKAAEKYGYAKLGGQLAGTLVGVEALRGFPNVKDAFGYGQAPADVGSGTIGISRSVPPPTTTVDASGAGTVDLGGGSGVSTPKVLEVKGTTATVETPTGTQEVPTEALQDEGFWKSVDWGSYAQGAIALAQLYSAYKQYKEGDKVGAGITAAQAGVNVAGAAGYQSAAQYAPWLAAAASLYGSGKAIFSGDLSPEDQAYESAMAAPRAAAAYYTLGASALAEGFARDQWGGTMRKLDNWNKNWWSGPIGLQTAFFKQIGSKKSGAQFLRDQIRERMIDQGALDENWQGTLADGSTFDFGLDGKQLKWKELDKIAAAQPEAWNAAVGLLDPMVSAYGLKGQKRADVVGWLARAAVSNAGDDSQTAIDNVKHFAQTQGLNFDTYQTLMNSFKSEGKITDDQYAQNMAGAERLFDVNLPDANPATIQKPAKGEVARVSPGMYMNDKGQIKKAKDISTALKKHYNLNKSKNQEL